MTGPGPAAAHVASLYRVHRLDLRTTLGLPDHLLVADAIGPLIDVAQQSARPVSRRPLDDDILREQQDDRVLLSVARSASGFDVRFPGLLGWTISPDLRSIAGWNDPAVSEAYLPVGLLGGVLAFVVSCLGDLCLHASAVEWRGGAVAFAGPSGRGKSTAAALAAIAGACGFSDDVVRVRAERGAILADRGLPEVRLRPNASSLAEQMAPFGAARPTVDGRQAVRLARSVHEALPLRAIVLPGPSRLDDAISVTPLDARHAFVALQSCLRLSGWRDRDLLERSFELVSAVADAVPVVHATFPSGPPFAPDAGERLLVAIDGEVGG